MLKAKILFVGPCEVRPGPGAASGLASGGGGASGAPPQEVGPGPTAPTLVCVAILTRNSASPDTDPVSLRPEGPS